MPDSIAQFALRAMLAASWLVGLASGQDEHDHDHHADHVHGRAEPEVPVEQAARRGAAPQFELLDVSLSFQGAFGTSSERDAELPNLKGGHHDPRKRGFTFQSLELSASAAVDPYFRLETHLLFFVDPQEGESEFEVEEAFGTASFLPPEFELELGYFLTEFGIVNPQHPHQWQWLDQPVIHSRIFGPDGMRGGGVRVAWRPGRSEEDTALHFGVQNANGEAMASFLASEEFYEERGVGGRAFQERDVRSFSDFVYLLRGETTIRTSDRSRLHVGASGLFGPNASGGDGETFVAGVDLRWHTQLEGDVHEGRFLSLQGEFLFRSFDADAFGAAGPPPANVPAASLDDYGFYLQALWGFEPRWTAGLRIDHASGSGQNVDPDTGAAVSRAMDPFRSDRLRISPLLSFAPSESSRFRLQYDYDDSDHLAGGEGDDAHSIWFGMEFLIGRHRAH